MMSLICPTSQPLLRKHYDGGTSFLLVCPPKVWYSQLVFLFYQLAIPHLLHVEDEYKGYRIPAGSMIIPNAWSVLLVPFISIL